MIGSGTGWMMALRSARSTVRAIERFSSPLTTACSRATASSSTSVALVMSTSECSEMSVSSTTMPASP
jgi:hypothetical protein